MQVMAIWCVHSALLKSGTASGSFSGYSKSYSFSTGKKLFSCKQIHKKTLSNTKYYVSSDGLLVWSWCRYLFLGMAQGDRKVMQPIPDTCSICQKINYTEIRKQKTMLYQVLEMSTAFSNAWIHSFPHVWCNPLKSFCSDGNSSPDKILSICLAQENQEMYP
jgi:hypothetical protein